jgi:antitoxin component of MazEF toxin-antitoxin module
MKAQMVKWGNSLAVRIPKPVAEEAKLKEGDPIEIEAARIHECIYNVVTIRSLGR